MKAEIEQGIIDLPDPGEHCVWSLYDSGSSINAADLEHHFPGATPSKSGRVGTFHNATGQPFQNQGEFEIPWLSEYRHAWRTVYLDAPVSMPIISSNSWASDGFRTVLDEHWGQTTKKDNVETEPLIVRNGTYFMKMRVDGSLLVPKPPTPAASRDVREPPKGFREANAA